MSDPERHKELVRKWFEEGVSSNDPETARRIADEVFAEDFQDGDAPGAAQNREQFKRMITERMYPVFKDVEAKVEHILAEGDWAAAYVRIEMTHVGEFYGVPGTGKRVSFTEAALSKMEDGQVKLVRGRSDWLSVLQQIGIAPTRPEREHRIMLGESEPG
jgi:predicted ester cyclase